VLTTGACSENQEGSLFEGFILDNEFTKPSTLKEESSDAKGSGR